MSGQHTHSTAASPLLVAASVLCVLVGGAFLRDASNGGTGPDRVPYPVATSFRGDVDDDFSCPDREVSTGPVRKP